MTVTVAIASYGYGHLVGHCIDSVLSQTVMPDRVVVVDDGAHDGAAQVAGRMGIEAVERDANLGVVGNFQAILESCGTDRLMLLGADNWLHPTCIEEMSRLAEADIVTCDLFVTGGEWRGYRDLGNPDKMRESGGVPVRRFKEYPDFRERINRSNVCHGSSLYNAAMAREVGGYRHSPGKRRPEEDWYLWKRMANAGADMRAVGKPLIWYRRHKDNFLGIY